MAIIKQESEGIMRQEIKSIIITFSCSALMLCVCMFSAKIIKNSILANDVQIEVTDSTNGGATEIVYIPIYMESYYETQINTEDNLAQEEYLIKLYNEKIGVFTKDDILLQVIDVYTKTLPKKDQDLLEKGFNINSNDLNKLIEDYTG